MYNNKEVIAIIGAAGIGKRMAAPLPKQYLRIGGKTILQTTVDKFSLTSLVDRILLVVSKEYQEKCLADFDVDQCPKVSVILGGAERQDSVGNAISQLQSQHTPQDAIVLVHDGVRPYISQEIIESVIKETDETGAVVTAVPTKDTIRHIENGTLDRSKLYNVQTPQGFKFEILSRAFLQAQKDGFYGTDESSMVERIGYKIKIVNGADENIKITTREDLKMDVRIGTGYDVHKLCEGRKLILGGINIPFDRGLLGHSDADVLVHALMDSMLGAAALGDIGKLFPDSDDEFLGISSLELLKRVNQKITALGYALGNADMTIICQKPKLAEFIPQMVSNIAGVLGVSRELINIKATTTEKLGFEGREEGIAAEAVCILKR